jgi:hypothetical protein
MAGVRREPAREFWDRVEREGRRERAEAQRDRLLEKGYSKRDAQSCLVQDFQPLDGSNTRAWRTPDSWKCGRRDAKKPPLTSRERFERDAQWVHENLGRNPVEAPTPGAKLLLEMAQKAPTEFIRIYVKCLPGITSRQKKELEARRNGVIERREAKRKRAAANKRAAYREAARLRDIETNGQAAIQAEARRLQEYRRKLCVEHQEGVRRQAESQKQAAEEEARKRKESQEQEQREQATKPKPCAAGQEPKSAVSSQNGEDWEVI